MKKLLILLLLIPVLCFGAEKFTPAGAVLKVIPHGTGTNRRGTLVDESGNAHNATIKGPVLEFSGASTRIEIDPTFNWVGVNEFSAIFAWVYHANATPDIYYEEEWDSGANKIQLGVAADDTLTVSVWSSDGGTERTYGSTATISQDTWHSLIVDIDKDNNRINWYLDGKLQDGGNNALSGAIGILGDVPDDMWWGSNTEETTEWFGYLRWLGLRSSGSVISATDAAAYHNYPGGWLAGAGMDAWWPCNEGTNATLLDRSGNDHPGKGVGITWAIAQVPGSYVNADTKMGIGTTAAGYIDLVTTDKVSQGDSATADNASVGAKIEIVGDVTAQWSVNDVVQSGTGSWHRVTGVTWANPNTEIDVTPAAGATDWDGETVEPFKGQLQILSEDAFAICMWWLPRTAGAAEYDKYISGGVASADGITFNRQGAVGAYRVFWQGSGLLQLDHTGHADLLRHSFAVVFDNDNGGGDGNAYSWIDKTDQQLDPSSAGLRANQPEFIRLGAKAVDGSGGATDTFGPFCLMDLSNAGTVDQDMREGIRDAWHDANMDFEVFATALRALLTGGEWITLTYWKLDEVPYGEEIDTDNIITRYSRSVTVGSSGAESADATDSDTENCAGFPLDTLGDSFKGSGWWMDEAQLIDFGDHADFSFSSGAAKEDDDPFSITLWTDLENVSVFEEMLTTKRAGASYEYRLYRQAGNTRLYFYLYSDGAVGTFIRAYTNSSVFDGTLKFVVATYDGSGEEAGLNIYIDNVNVVAARTEAGTYAGMTDTAALLRIRQIQGAHIYNYQLYNRELSANEIQALFNQGPYR